LTTQKSKSQQHSESDTVSGSTLNAGNNLSVVATGKNRGKRRLSTVWQILKFLRE
ncbi:TPA: hemagglutinin repeat-containing protein, partial [Escherichia coli]|nr:hemagglutinin repeat-containing protein [Escherichia coli]